MSRVCVDKLWKTTTNRLDDCLPNLRSLTNKFTFIALREGKPCICQVWNEKQLNNCDIVNYLNETLMWARDDEFIAFIHDVNNYAKYCQNQSCHIKQLKLPFCCVLLVRYEKSFVMQISAKVIQLSAMLNKLNIQP